MPAMMTRAGEHTTTVCNRVRRRMVEVGVSYGDLAEEAGVSLTTIRRIASAQTQPRLETALRMARCLECAVSELFFVERP